MPTNVPPPTFGATGFIAPTTQEVLAGVQADLNSAFGGNLNPSPTTPQGQIATSEAAVIADCNSQFLALANGVDPAFAYGRMQDAIARIYGLSRIAAQSTVVIAQCVGAVNTVIPVGTTAQDQDANIYICTQAGVIDITGTIDLEFQALQTGPLACPSGFLTTIVSTIPGWDTINNSAAGVPGFDVESREAFAQRMSQSVAISSTGILPAVVGNILNLPNVSDCYGIQNPLPISSGAIFTGSIASSVMTVDSGIVGTISVGMIVTGVGVISGTYVLSLGSGTGGAGTYNINYPQTVGSETLNCNISGVAMVPHSVYISVVGGDPNDIAQTMFDTVSNGCAMNGNTTVTIQDIQPYYTIPYPSYQITFERPSAVPILFNVTMQNNPNVPSGAVALVKEAIIASFNGADGGQKARIGSNIYSSRFYSPISNLGSWAIIYSIFLGIDAANQLSVLMRADQVPTVSESNITVAFI